MNLHHIGQDFSKTIKLHLLPGIDIPKGIFMINVQYVTETNSIMTMHHGSYMTDHRELEVFIGRDVRDITIDIHRHNSYPANPNVRFRYRLRIDQLILLNLASKLLKLPRVGP